MLVNDSVQRISLEKLLEELQKMPKIKVNEINLVAYIKNKIPDNITSDKEKM